MVLLLYGPSCSGKSSLGRALQSALPFPAVRIEADTAFPALPDGHVGWNKADMHGEVVRAFHRSAAAWAERGFHLIVDGSLPYEDRALRDDCLEMFGAFDVRLIGVSCDLPELNQREKERLEQRPLGWSARQAKDIHYGMRYAIRVDTTRQTPAECADEIVRRLAATD